MYLLQVKSEGLAQAVAHEWRSQKETVIHYNAFLKECIHCLCTYTAFTFFSDNDEPDASDRSC